jgi:hypothetical protein
MAIIVAPEAWQRGRGVGRATQTRREGLLWRQVVKERAGSGARFVRAIGAVAAIVVQLAWSEGDGRIADASKAIARLVEMRNFRSMVSFPEIQT